MVFFASLYLEVSSHKAGDPFAIARNIQAFLISLDQTITASFFRCVLAFNVVWSCLLTIDKDKKRKHSRLIEHIPATTTVNASSREKESIAMQYTLYTNAKEKTWER